MRAVIQRVSSCVLYIGDNEYSRIGSGLLILLGIEEADNADDIEWLSAKITGLRLFDDDKGVMNLDVTEISGEIMVVSQFTLHASIRKGNRPSYTKAARPEIAKPAYEAFIQSIETNIGYQVATGEFGAHMEIALVNDGPVTILIDTKNKE
jgi:D-tyrosyl-tRNA(Tyr) deacylase